METIGDRIRARRDQLGWTQAKLSEMLNIKVGTLSGYERNYRLPDARMLQLLAGIMNVSSDYLLGLPPSEPKQTTRSLPIIGTIKSSVQLLTPENIDGYLEMPNYIEADYILTVKDDNMIGAGILEGDYVICKESEVAVSGQIVVALEKKENGFTDATLKYYFHENGTLLTPGNPHYPEIKMPEGFRIAGVMVALIRKETAGYETYNKSLPPSESQGWNEIINLSSQAGLKAQQVKEIVLGQIEIARRLNGI